MSRNTAAPSVWVRGGFGKLPTQSDFVRVTAGGRELLALDQWLQEGLYHARQELGAGWEPLYDDRLHHRFVYRADNCGYTVVGVVRAAMDVLERRFPFTAFGLLPTRLLDANPLLIPRLDDVLFRALEQTIEDVAGMDDLALIRARLQGSSMLPSPPPASNARYATFLDEVLCVDLGRTGPEDSLDLLARVITALSAAHPHPRQIPVALELPLGHAPYARGLEIRFWLELCLILLRWYPPSLSLFWPTGTPPPRDCTLQICFRQPAGSLLGALLRENGLARGVWRPEQRQAFPGAGSRSPRLPVGPDEPLRSLLETLCPGYPDACRWYQDGDAI